MLNLSLKKNNENTREYIYRTLKENITNLNLVPGEMISESEISNIFQVSRTPVREAFIKLSEENFLEILPQKGTFVTKINIENVKEAIFMRENLEKAVFSVAIEKLNNKNILELEKIIDFQETILELNNDMKTFFELDNKFHFIIFNLCGFDNIWKSIQNISQDYNRFRNLDSLFHLNIIKIIKQHKAILKAIKTKDFELFEETISHHLRNTSLQISSLKESYQNYFL